MIETTPYLNNPPKRVHHLPLIFAISASFIENKNR